MSERGARACSARDDETAGSGTGTRGLLLLSRPRQRDGRELLWVAAFGRLVALRRCEDVFSKTAFGDDGDSKHAAFLEAVNFGDMDKVRRYLKDPAININYAEPGTGLTALHIAAGRNAGAVLRLLVSTRKCDYTLKDAEGRTAATIAVVVGRNPAAGRYLFDLQHRCGIAVPRAARRSAPTLETDSD